MSSPQFEIDPSKKFQILSDEDYSLAYEVMNRSGAYIERNALKITQEVKAIAKPRHLLDCGPGNGRLTALLREAFETITLVEPNAKFASSLRAQDHFKEAAFIEKTLAQID